VSRKTTGALNARSRLTARWFWLATIALGVVGTIVTFAVQPHITASFFARPWGYIFPLITLVWLAVVSHLALRPKPAHSEILCRRISWIVAHTIGRQLLLVVKTSSCAASRC
jgi:cytochrome bd-type quinol oxidase subunit 2